MLMAVGVFISLRGSASQQGVTLCWSDQSIAVSSHIVMRPLLTSSDHVSSGQLCRVQLARPGRPRTGYLTAHHAAHARAPAQSRADVRLLPVHCQTHVESAQALALIVLAFLTVSVGL